VKISYPTVTKKEKRISAFEIPILSSITPPNRGNIILGNE
jgi:hypothetical protein